MGDYPWGPHGPRSEPNSVLSNPTPSYVPPAAESWPSYTPTPGSTGGGGGPVYYSGGGTADTGVIGRAFSFLFSLLLVPFVWQLWLCLYPIASLSGLATVVAGLFFLGKIMPPAPGFAVNPRAVLIAYAAGLVVLVIVSRLDHRLAQHAVYRIPRHAVRLILLAGLAIVFLQEVRGIPGFGRGPIPNLRLLGNSENMIMVLAFLAGMHFLMWHAKTVRQIWHHRLEAIGLRSAKLAD